MSRQKRRVYIEKITHNTAMGLKDWGNFDDPRLSGYNYGNLTDFEINFWFSSVTTPRKKYFAVKKLDDDKQIKIVNGLCYVSKDYPLPADFNPGVDRTARRSFETMRQDMARDENGDPFFLIEPLNHQTKFFDTDWVETIDRFI